MPEVVGHLAEDRELLPIVGGEALSRKPLEERAAREDDDQKHGEQEPRNGVADDERSRCPHVEAAAITDGLANAERDGDQVGCEHHPEAERYGNRQLLLDQLDDADIAIVAAAEIETRKVPDELAVALVPGPVEAELLLQLLDELLVETL